MKLTENGIPRRNRIELDTPAETAIRRAMSEVESAGAHPLLTDAVVLLLQAKDKVSDYAEIEVTPEAHLVLLKDRNKLFDLCMALVEEYDKSANLIAIERKIKDIAEYVNRPH